MSEVRLSLQRKEAAEALGVSGDHFDRHIRPHLPCVYVGAVRLWLVSDLEAWLAKERTSPVDSEANEKRPRAAATAGGMAQGE